MSKSVPLIGQNSGQSTRRSSRLILSSVCSAKNSAQKLKKALREEAKELSLAAIIGSQAFQNGRCHISFSLGLDRGIKRTHSLSQILIVLIHTGLLAVNFYLKVGATLSLLYRKVSFHN